MERKGSVGVRVFGWSEIIIGILGSFQGLISLFASSILVISKQNLRCSLPLLLSSILVFIPFPFLIVCGIGMLKLKQWARKINLWIMHGFILTITFLYITFWREYLGIQALISSLIVLALICLIICFLTRPKVKDQFK